MKRDIALKWAKALESGEYQQCQGTLRKAHADETSFCCLGVLCNLHAESHPEIAAEQWEAAEYMGFDCDLPPEVAEWAGMQTQDGKFIDDFEIAVPDSSRHADCLIALNDDYNFDFKQIAKVIRKHSDKL